MGEVSPPSASSPHEAATTDDSYDAFISYAHHDRAAAIAVHNALRRLAVSRFSRSPVRIYRDDTDLASTPQLWSTIAEALDRSRHLVVLASPASARSSAVDWEVRHFLGVEPPRPVHIVLVDGTLRWVGDSFDEESTALLPALRTFRSEPLVLDLGAPAAHQLSLRNDDFHRCMVRLAAPVRGLTPIEIYDTDRTNRRRALRQALVAIVLLVVFLGAAVYGGVEALRSSQEAQRQATRATARYLAAQSASLLGREPELGMLAAVHASALEDSVGTRQALLAAVQRSPTVTGSARTSDGAPFADVAVSPSGRTVVTVDQRDRIQAWDVRAGAPVLRAGTDGGTLPLDVTVPSDDEVVAVFDSGDVLTWHPGDGGRDVWRPADTPIAAFVEGTGGYVVTADERFVVTLWDRASHRAVVTSEPLPARPDVVAVSTDRTRFAVAADRQVTVHDLTGGRSLGAPVDLGPGYSPSVAFSPTLDKVIADSRHTDNLLVTNDTVEAGHRPDAEGVLLIDLANGTRSTGAKPGGTTTALRFLPGGSHVVAGEDTGEFRVLSLSGPPYVGTEPGHVGIVSALATNADGTVGASVDRGGRLLLHDLTLRADLGTGSRAPGPLPPQQSARVSDLTFDATDHRLLSAADDGQVLLSAVGTGEVLATVNGVGTRPDQNVVGSRFAPDGAVVFTNLSGSIGRLPVGPAEQTPERVAGPGQAALVATAPDGRIVSGGRDGSVRVWERPAGSWTSALLSAPTDKAVVSVDVSPDGRLLAFGRENAAAEVWDLGTGQRLQVVPDRTRAIAVIGASPAVRFGADSRTLAVGRPDGTVVLWDTSTGSTIGEPVSIGEGAVSAVALSPDGSMLAAVEDQGRGVALVDVGSRQPIGAVATSLGRTSAVRFSHDGSRLAVANVDGAVQLIDVSVPSWRKRLCAVAGREVTDNEWERLVGDYPRTDACR